MAMGERITGGLVLGASLAFSSTVLAIKVLDDGNELSSLHGRDVLSILILQDIVAIGLLAGGKTTDALGFDIAAFTIAAAAGASIADG
jgi:Kef-type K+ transport system membrane component KefB